MKTFRIMFAFAAALTAAFTVQTAMLAQEYGSTRVPAGTPVQQKNDKKSFTLRGVVEGVDAKAGRLTVNHEKVEGWMAAMTMAYAVDKPEDLQRVKVGDRIEATVYQDEYKLYDIKVTGKK
jgi:Cu/Ag efflux protein CusF